MKLADPPAHSISIREWIWEYKTGEDRLWSRGTVEPLYRGNHLCTSVCVLHREVYLIQIRSTSLGLQAVSSIERCPPFTLLHMLHCIQIHIAIQIPSQVTLYSDSYCDSDSFTGYTVFRFRLRFRFLYRLHCTHTPLSHTIASQSPTSLYKLLTMLQSLVYTNTHNVSWVECGRGHMVRKESFSPMDICICNWVRFDKYNTINWSCSGGGGGW